MTEFQEFSEEQLAKAEQIAMAMNRLAIDGGEELYGLVIAAFVSGVCSYQEKAGTMTKLEALDDLIESVHNIEVSFNSPN